MSDDVENNHSRFIHLACPKCQRKSSQDGFRVRGQFCICGWSRDEPETTDPRSEAGDS